MELLEKKKQFLNLFDLVSREGKDELLDFIKNSDFFVAPASTRFHDSCEGGLLTHSLNVYDSLIVKYTNNPIWREKLKDLKHESIIISALLHDLCKTNYYVIEMRNKKVDGKWIQVPFYTVDDKEPYGHGEKSVMMIERFMKLTDEERYAVRWHMGPYSGQQDWNSFGLACEKFSLVLALFESDMEATHLV